MSLLYFIILGLALLFCGFSFTIHFSTKDNTRKIYTFYFRIASSLYLFSVLFPYWHSSPIAYLGALILFAVPLLSPLIVLHLLLNDRLEYSKREQIKMLCLGLLAFLLLIFSFISVLGSL